MVAQEAVVVGVGQVRRRPGLDGPWEPVDPARLIARAASAAIEDSGLAGIATDTDALGLVPPIAWGYEDLAGTVSGLVGLTGNPAVTRPLPGGEASCNLLNEIADRIGRGDARIAVVTGGETMYSTRRARREGIDLTERGWPRYTKHRDLLGGQRPIVNDLEKRHGLLQPTQCYPLFENAMRARAGRSVRDHQDYLARILAPHSGVAARNPYAWFPQEWTEEQLTTVDTDNRLICFPYPKRMNAVLEVDQAAALVVMSGDEARRRGVPEHRRVRLLGGASASDAWTVTERADLTSSPGCAAAVGRALEHAGVGVADVAMFDLYSSFPCAVQFGMDALGITVDDPRPRSVTGGLAYHGGPHQYSLHAAATMVGRLRDGPAQVGVCTGMGMTATKHSATVLAGSQAPVSGGPAMSGEVPLRPVEIEGPPLVEAPEPGDAEVESYTVEFDRSGAPATTVFVLRTGAGERTVANLAPGCPELDFDREHVGVTGRVEPGRDGAPNRFSPK